MKDQEARAMLLAQAQEIHDLRTAFDALFDVVAADLGYQAGPDLKRFYPGYSLSVATPRQFATTVPHAELVRVPARFKKG